MAGDTATELLFIDTFKHQSAEVMSRKPHNCIISTLPYRGECAVYSVVLNRTLNEA